LHVGKALLAKPFIGFRMRQIVRDVGKPGAPRLELLNECQRLIYGLVHGMRNVSQRI